MRVGIAQLDFTIGAFDTNLEKMRSAAEGARSQRVDLLLFSELATTGYPPKDLLDRSDFVARNLVQLERVAALSDDSLGIVVGFVDRNPDATGKRLLNSAALCHRGKVVGIYRKCLLPTYDVFDEARHFEPGGAARPLEFRNVRLGVTICEDIWNDPDFWPQRLYRRDPVAELVDQGAQLLINISASPFTVGKGELRRAMLSAEAAKHGRYLLAANQVGANDELVFDGHSLGFDPTGRLVLRARDFAEDLLFYEIPDAALTGAGAATAAAGEIRPVAADDVEAAYRALVLGLADYASKCGFREVVLGLSGGIDSALTAAVAADALGPENVLAVAMPTRYSSEASLSDAEALAAALGVELRVIPVDEVFQVYLDTMMPSFSGLEADVTEENIQARVRGNVLMALSNKLGRLLLSTGNKSELAVGYCTLYGDMSGGLAVISDVPKTMVYQICRWLNRERTVIPESILTKAPSAELSPGQTDQDSLPPYDVLDRILELYVEQNRSPREIVGEGLDGAVVRRVIRLIDGAEYKRRQAAPGIKLTSKAFGGGRRLPIAADYRALDDVEG
ncbi:MAG: NAD+ synthase [Acidobacteria bacterium]|nr:NAD+ synthase [Acidobacteriota bacterium]